MQAGIQHYINNCLDHKRCVMCCVKYWVIYRSPPAWGQAFHKSKLNAIVYFLLKVYRLMSITIRLIALFLLLSSNLWADTASPWYSLDPDKKVQLNVKLFVSSTCPYCHKAESFFQGLEAKNPWLHVQRFVINQDKNALIYFNELLTEQHMNDFAVPSIFFCNSRWVGFAGEQTTGSDLVRGLNYCKKQIEAKGKLSDATETVLQRWGNANFFDANIEGTPSATRYIISVALIDAFNPCALFTIAAFFALLFLQDQRKKLITGGLLFILVVGSVHYFQQVYPTAFFVLLPWLRVPAALVGLFTFYLAGQYYRNRNHANLLFILIALLAFMIQSYQQTCLMNWAYIFEQWLHKQHISLGQKAWYQMVYQFMYLVPLAIIFKLYLMLSKAKFMSRLSHKLKITGLLFLMAIGLLLIIYPLALANLALSLFMIVALAICGLFLSKFSKVSKSGEIE